VVDREIQAVDQEMRTDLPSNENKMSDGGRERALLGVEVWKSSQKGSVKRSAVRSIAWLDVADNFTKRRAQDKFLPTVFAACANLATRLSRAAAAPANLLREAAVDPPLGLRVLGTARQAG
jgi:hypothetical protein